MPQLWVKGKIFGYEKPQSSQAPAVPVENEQWRPVQQMAMLRHILDMAKPSDLGFRPGLGKT